MAAIAFDDDRLPWLEPYRDPTRVGSSMPGLALVVGGIAALTAAYHFGPRDPAVDAPAAMIVTAPVTAAPADASAPAPRPVVADAPKQSSSPTGARPGPPGQVIQLGAFQKIATANRAYRAYVARYPLLRPMPRVIVPITTTPSGRTLYALRVGTASRQQSGIVCRNLRASGEQCLVIG